jgi:transposase
VEKGGVMPSDRRRPQLTLTGEVIDKLQQISKSRSESAGRVERAKMILAYSRGDSISAIARRHSTGRAKIQRCIKKALQFGALTALDDLPRSGRPPEITPEARIWLVNSACQKPKDFGYSFELWTNRLLAEYAHKHCEEAGHPSLKNISRGTVSKILQKSGVRPHKITYYLEYRDPEFESKMTQVLRVYKEVELIKKRGEDFSFMPILSYDEKPGIQAIANTAPDLPPLPGEHPCIARDHEYERCGTVSLLAGIDLLTGQVHGIVAEHHRSCEFVEYLRMLDNYYPKDAVIRIILDNHSAHISKETKAYLSGVQQRFEFIFTPKHGSWLNIVESLFAKMTKTFFRGIRVGSKEELKQRIEKWLEEINQTPVVFRWKYGLDSISVA